MQFLNIGPAEMILILVLALIVFGPGKLPEIGRAVGKSIGEFRRATSDLTREFSASIDEVKQPFNDVKGAIAGTASTATATTAVGLTCPSCSANNPLTNKFCRDCGARLVPDEPTATCSFCQASNPASNKFCRECGSPMPVAEAVSETPVETTNFAATGFTAAEATSELTTEATAEATAEQLPEPQAESAVNAEAPAPEGQPESLEAAPAEVAEKAS